MGWKYVYKVHARLKPLRLALHVPYRPYRRYPNGLGGAGGGGPSRATPHQRRLRLGNMS